MIRVYLVDDHDVIRAGLRQILELDPEITVVGETSRALDAIRLVDAERPDVIFMDIRMPGMNGIEATRILRDKHPNMKVVLLTNFDEKEYLIEGLKAGAAGYLLKEIGKEELHKIVHAVHNGKSVLDPSATSILIKETFHNPAPSGEAPAPAPPEKLTTREFEVLELISRGQSNKEIGAKLFVTDQTVKFHVKTIFRKLGAKSRSEAVYKAVQNSLISQKSG